MEYIKDININEAVLHILNNNKDEPVFNNYMLELTEDTYMFLYKHLNKCLKNEELKYAKFNGKDQVNNLAQLYFNGEASLIDISKDITKRLFSLNKEKDNFSSCDIVIVSLSTEFGPLLGILKMDYVKNYIHDIKKSEHGDVGIDIVIHKSSLPGNKKLQKCAFIQPYRDSNEFDLMVIDMQNKKQAEKYGSDYFIERFLECHTINNERDLTKQFIESTAKWSNRYLKSAESQEKVISSIRKRLKEEDNINIDELSSDLFEDTLIKESFKDSLIDGLEGEEDISIDKKFVDKRFKKIKLKIDKDIDLCINEEVYNDIARFEIKPNKDGTLNIVIKNIINYIEK